MRPLLSVAGTADALRGGDLSARATPADPTEVRRLAAAPNGLADRIADLPQAEREAAADLSHRLRTPLTALRLGAEGLRDLEEAERVLASVAGVERMVSHVIAQARRPTRETGAVADAAAVVRERVDFWSGWRRTRGPGSTIRRCWSAGTRADRRPGWGWTSSAGQRKRRGAGST